MNLLDWGVIIFLGIFALIGFYQGFVRNILQLISFFVSWLFGLIISPVFKPMLYANKLVSSLSYYIDGSEFLSGNYELARASVADLSSLQMQQFTGENKLPFPLGKLVERNLVTEAFVSGGYNTVSETISQTILHFFVNIAAFLIAYLVIRAILTLIISVFDYSKGLPVIIHNDSLISTGFGAVRGFFTLFVVAMFIPVLLVLLQQMGASNLINVKVNALFDESSLAKFFYESNFLLSMIKGT